MKKRILALALALAMALALFPAAALAAQLPFNDVTPADWFYPGVSYAYEHGLVNGTGADTFSPDQLITRAMFITFLHRLEGEPAASGVTFLDVPVTSWFAQSVSWARGNQIVFGYGDGSFGPDDVLNREQMVVILYRYAEYKGYDLSADSDLSFTDAGDLSDYAVAALRWAVSFGIINGVGGGAVAPQGDVTRAQVAALLTRFDQNAGPVAGRVVLSNFVAGSTELIVGEEHEVVFTVKVSGVEPTEDLYLYVNDQRMVRMFDNGTNGDAVAGDGIYTTIWYATNSTVTTVNCYVRCGAVKSRSLTIQFLDGGTLTGLVCDSADRRPLTNATLYVYRDGWLCTTSGVDAEGRYRLSLPAGLYLIQIVCDGYVIFSAYATVSGGNNTYTETYMMISGVDGTAGYATGVITNALTGQPLGGVALYVRAGWNNTSVGSIVASGYTDASGAYRFDLPVGNYTIYAVMDGFIGVVINIFVSAGGSTSQNGSISPVVTTGDYRIVLTWGKDPSDLDSHVQQRDLYGTAGYHVYYSNKNGYINGTKMCNLDVDDVTSYGPETVTLTTQEGDAYYYYIYHFAGSGYLRTSDAVIRVYQGSNQLATFNVPTDQGNDRYWNVFAIKDGRMIVKNTITGSPDTTYAQ